MLDKEWFSADELAGLALEGFPGTKRGVQLAADAGRWLRSDWQDKYWRLREGRGGGVEYHYTLLPPAARAAVTVRFTSVDAPAPVANAEITREELAARYERLPDRRKDKAKGRLRALQAVEAKVLAGTALCVARLEIAREMEISPTSLSNWAALVAHVPAQDRLYHLISHHAGRVTKAEVPDEAWNFLLPNYLRPSQPTFEQCFRDLEVVANSKGWTLPSKRTLQRRIDALPETTKVFKRQGAEALARMHPAQERDRSVFHALEAVNSDGHKVDVFVQFPGEKTPIRPMLIGWQDLYSGMIVSWRVDKSENKEVIRLSFGDMIENYGIPVHAYLDNGRAYWNKDFTGRAPERNRFKARDEDPTGLMNLLGVQVHPVRPFNGKAKPIERAWGDIARDLAKDMRFEGAYTGRSVETKPDNYGQRAIPLEEFLKVAAERIAEHNARIGRDTKVCQGRSFLETFNESYAKSEIRKATSEQRRLWLLAADGITASKVDGALMLMDNRFWAPFLNEHRGQKLTVRFDPQAVQKPLSVYRLDGSFLGEAACIEASGFNDEGAARDHAKAGKLYAKARKQQAEALVTMSLKDAAKQLAAVSAEEPAELPEAKIVRPVFAVRGNAALKPVIQEEEDADDRMFAAMREMNRARGGTVHLRAVVTEENGD